MSGVEFAVVLALITLAVLLLALLLRCIGAYRLFLR